MITDLRTLIERIRSHERSIRELGIAHLDIFGSWAGGRADEQSDVDLVAVFDADSRASYFQLARLKRILEADLAMDVDVLSERGIRDNGTSLGQTVRVF